MKNAIRYCAGPVYYRMCSTDVYCSNKPAAVAPKAKPSPIIFVSGNWAEENCRCSQNLWRRRKMLLKQETQQTFVNGLLGFITLGIYTPLEACIAHNNLMSCPSIWATLSALPVIMFPGFLPAPAVVISFEGEIIPFSGVCQSGEAALSTPEAVVASRTDRQTALMCNRRRPAATSSRRASFSALASANSFVFCIERSNITLTHLHVSNCRVRQLQFSGIFVALALW